jgi:TRAP-type uncharacterized transport system substrate-binding protein
MSTIKHSGRPWPSNPERDAPLIPSRPLRIALAVCTLALAALLARQAAAAPVYTVLHDGAVEGVTRFVDDLAHLWRASDLERGSVLAGRATAPAPARLQALRRGQATFAIVDAGLLALQKPLFPDLAAVVLLWPEPLHLVTSQADPAVLAALPGEVLIAESARYAMAALAADPAPPELRWLLVAPGGLATALQRRPLPLLAVGGLPPVPELTQALAAPELRLAAIARPLLERARAQYPWLAAALIPANTYPRQAQTLETLAVHQVLVTRVDTPAPLVRQAFTALFRWQERMAAASARFAALERKANGPAAAWFPYHAEAARALGLAPSAPAAR